MARKPDPERIYHARRAAELSILRGSGCPEDRAEAYMTAWEDSAACEGRQRLTAAFWDGASEWIAARRERR
jgi:hypothetical protein